MTPLGDLMPLYPGIRHAHILLVCLSGLLFTSRGLGVLAGAAWPTAAWARRLSVGLDILLLTAGTTLWSLLALNPLRDHWLLVKLLLLMLYIVGGSVAMKRGRTRRVKAIALLSALAIFATMVTIAHTHHPLGWLGWLGGPA